MYLNEYGAPYAFRKQNAHHLRLDALKNRAQYPAQLCQKGVRLAYSLPLAHYAHTRLEIESDSSFVNGGDCGNTYVDLPMRRCRK